ncbi:RNA-directed DNA polymerase from mobile element jockey, partial [Camponotus floridanus]
SAVIIKENIKHHEEINFSSEIIQATTIRIYIKKLQCNISAVYSSPRHNIMVEDYIEFLQSLGNRFVAGGDFNSKHTCWGSRLTTTKRRRLLEAVQTLSCNVLLEGTPTYWPSDRNKRPDVIDMFI